MRKFVSVLLLLGVITVFTACGGRGEPVPSSRISSAAPATLALPEPSVPPVEPSPAFQGIPPEPEETGQAELDFLTDEQMTLYQSAQKFSRNGGWSEPMSFITKYGCKYGGSVSIEGQPVNFSLVEGKYRNYDDFYAMVQGIFTEDCLKLMSVDHSFVSYNGQLAVSESGFGGTFEVSDVPDTYRLIQKTDTLIEFVVVAHYTNLQENESDEDYMARRAISFDQLIEYPTRLVLTDAGWRVDELYSPNQCRHLFTD